MKVELFNDNFQNFKRYGIPKAQLVIADIPYNLGNNAYASNPMWYVDGDNKNGESKKAGKAFFNSDYNFNIAEYFHFCNRLLKKEPKERGQAPCMIVFCSFQQMPMVIEYAKKHGFKNYIPITFNKNYSAQVLKANMRIVGATEYALVLYREKLPTQKPISVLKRLIEIFTDEGDVVIDPVAGSGSTLRAAMELGRSAYGFEIDRRMYAKAKAEMLSDVKIQTNLMEFAE